MNKDMPRWNLLHCPPNQGQVSIVFRKLWDGTLEVSETAQFLRHELPQINIAMQINLRNGNCAHPFHSSIILVNSLNR